MLAYSAPPGYRRQDPPRRPKLEPFTGVIDAILEADRQVPRKQRHTAKRIFERLRDEHGFTGQYTIVKDYVSEGLRPRAAATDAGDVRPLVPCTGSHAPGHAQCDFGEAVAVIAGVERKVHYFVLDLPHSDGLHVLTPRSSNSARIPGSARRGVSLIESAAATPLPRLTGAEYLDIPHRWHLAQDTAGQLPLGRLKSRTKYVTIR